MQHIDIESKLLGIARDKKAQLRARFSAALAIVRRHLANGTIAPEQFNMWHWPYASSSDDCGCAGFHASRIAKHDFIIYVRMHNRAAYRLCFSKLAEKETIEAAIGAIDDYLAGE